MERIEVILSYLIISLFLLNLGGNILHNLFTVHKYCSFHKRIEHASREDLLLLIVENNKSGGSSFFELQSQRKNNFFTGCNEPSILLYAGSELKATVNEKIFDSDFIAPQSLPLFSEKILFNAPKKSPPKV